MGLFGSIGSAIGGIASGIGSIIGAGQSGANAAAINQANYEQGQTMRDKLLAHPVQDVH
jgi:hypothetical protein